MLVNHIKRLLSLWYSERMVILARIIILPLFIVIRYCLNKTSDLTFIGCHNVRLQSCLMVMTTFMHAPSWRYDGCVCTLTRFVPYSLHKFRLTLSFSYMWLWHISVLTLCHVLSADYVHVRLVHFFSLFLHFQAVETFFCTVFLFLRVVYCPISFCLHTGFDSFSSCLRIGLDLFLVWPNRNRISIS